MTWRWNAFSMRLTPTRPSRTRRELRREGIVPSCADHVRPGDPVLDASLLAVEAHPEKPEEQRRDAGEVTGTADGAPRGGRPVAVDIDDPDPQQAHAERAAEDD